MSSLIPTSEFDRFNTSKQYSFNVSNLPLLKISANCPIGIFKGNANKVTVEIDADEETLKEFVVRQSGNTIEITQRSESSGTFINSFGGGVSIGNGRTTVVTGGQNVSIINGRVYINGKEVTEDGSMGKARSLPKIRITAPSSDLEANMRGESLLVSQVPFQNSFLDLSGSCKVGIATQSLEIDASGTGEIKAIIGGGDLNIGLSGMSSVDVQGDFSQARVSLSGMGDITTRGNCLGNYSVNASGMGRVNHLGSIAGRVRKSVSGMATVSI